MRGIHVDALGNTPTCVGKTQATLLLVSIPWKHPHLRGEDMWMRAYAALFAETPPPAWGRL